MSDYTIRVSYNPKPGPRADHLLWDAWADGDEEAGCVHGPTAADALREMADRLEDEAETAAKKAECPACGFVDCLCDYLRSDRGVNQIIYLDEKSWRRYRDLRSMQDTITERAVEVLACESLLEQRT